MPEIRYVDKRANDKFPIRITFVDTDPAIDYQISTLVVTALDDTGNDVSGTLIDAASNQTILNKAIVWVQGGTAGKKYTVLVKAGMASGETFEQKIVVTVLT